jgi:hypothetical protein
LIDLTWNSWSSLSKNALKIAWRGYGFLSNEVDYNISCVQEDEIFWDQVFLHQEIMKTHLDSATTN